MQLSDARKLCGIGQIRGCELFKVPMKDAYTIQFDVSPQVVLQYGNQLHTKRGDVREFHSLDRVTSVIEDIGLGRFRVVLKGSLD